MLLLTGFEPFGGDGRNPAGEIAAGLDGTVAGGCRVRGLVVPVAAEAAMDAVAGEMKKMKGGSVAGVLAVGVSRRAVVSVEVVAVNRADYRMPDNHGVVKTAQRLVPRAPDAWQTAVDVGGLVQALRGAGVPAEASLSAGSYVCNDFYFRLLHRHGPGVKGGVPVAFLHIPRLPEMVAAAGSSDASMALETSRRAVEVALHFLAAGGRVEA